MEPLKEMFNAAYFRRLEEAVSKAYPKFKQKDFHAIMLQGLEPLSLNERLRKTTNTLHTFLGDDFEKSLSILKESAKQAPTGYTALVFPDYVGQFGLHDFKSSLPALAYFTSFGSSEFAIREFLRKDFDACLPTLLKWTKDNNHHVRRLASEGSRPRLPWSFKLDRVIQEPQVTTEILQNLNTDETLYVRKSVANHLNDISKDNADYLLRTLKTWNQAHPHTAWITKHATRSLVKQGDARSLQLLNFEKNVKCRIENLKITKRVKLGERLEIAFELVSEKKQIQKLVVDYCIHYVKQSGKASAKVFKLKNVDLKAGERLIIKASQLIKDFTTRKHFAGKHKLEILVNGEIKASSEFLLQVK